MAEKGELPPAYPRIQQSDNGVSNRKWLLGLLFYAGAVTAALVVMATMGSLYIGRVEQFCQQPHYMEPDSPSGQTKEVTANGERVVVDPVANKEVIYPSGEGLQGSIVVIDHNKGIIGMYMPESDECYLIGGVDNRIPNATEILRAFENGQGDDLINPEHPESVTYAKASDWPVKDLTLLPRELHAPCWGKPVFWLERSPEEGSGPDRAKRSCPRQMVHGAKLDYLDYYNHPVLTCVELALSGSQSFVIGELATCILMSLSN